MSIVGVTSPSSQSDQAGMTNWFDQLLVWDVALAPNHCMQIGTKDMLFESVFGWGSIVADISVVMAMV